ncbi:DUF2516 domain-containing protein [Actinoalloteichus sp. AHMU CJ021]|uniref:DUF2516 family protein n=1 Tax=Actinoalloteichus caeruleus DSM 43889 TaxID=1120930 RepID=A0ABT1JLC2_ACTCY|nr:DUF2516 family protein [Actinoalloteichus caeruleus]AUS79056.1 DUF2516 domain-containing protein [Actinoalloteichus sp. AHMU CJ021]MCP2333300.1 Protein of unknown function (DUF2516) [Actinoalloteichus caeruleus DSM 43889]
MYQGHPALEPIAWILLAIKLAGIPVGAFAFLHAVTQRADAFVAADKLSKNAWMGITGGATLVLLLFHPIGLGTMFWIAGLVAALVYIVDVRPRITDVQRGPRW